MGLKSQSLAVKTALVPATAALPLLVPVWPISLWFIFPTPWSPTGYGKVLCLNVSHVVSDLTPAGGDGFEHFCRYFNWLDVVKQAKWRTYDLCISLCIGWYQVSWVFKALILGIVPTTPENLEFITATYSVGATISWSFWVLHTMYDVSLSKFY